MYVYDLMSCILFTDAELMSNMSPSWTSRHITSKSPTGRVSPTELGRFILWYRLRLEAIDNACGCVGTGIGAPLCI